MAEKSLDAFKRKIPDSWQTGWKEKACTNFVLYLKVFKNHLHYLWHVRVLFIKPCLHTQLPEHNKSHRKVSRGWGHLITWNGPMMGHLNSFSASGGGNLNKNFPKIQMPGVARGVGGDVEDLIWLLHNWLTRKLYDWLKKLETLSHPVRHNTKTNQYTYSFTRFDWLIELSMS